MRTRLSLLCLFIALPVAAQNAFFSRATVLPLPGINAPLPTAILAADFNQDGIADQVIAGQGAVVTLLGQAFQSQSEMSRGSPGPALIWRAR
jgi:hypothetical protein